MKLNAIRSWEMTLKNFEYAALKLNTRTKLYQMKVLSDKQRGKDRFIQVRVYTNRPDSLLNDFGAVLGNSKSELQTRLGMKTDEDKAKETAAKERKRKLAEVRRHARELAKANGYKLNQLFS